MSLSRYADGVCDGDDHTRSAFRELGYGLEYLRATALPSIGHPTAFVAVLSPCPTRRRYGILRPFLGAGRTDVATPGVAQRSTAAHPGGGQGDRAPQTGRSPPRTAPAWQAVESRSDARTPRAPKRPRAARSIREGFPAPERANTAGCRI